MYTSRILAAGHYVPERIVTNAELCQMMNTTSEWIVERTGIQERHWYTPGVDTVTNMAAKASKMAMERAGVEKDEIDFIDNFPNLDLIDKPLSFKNNFF